ncbi:MAG: BLUF domain-containing protein [Oceanihabitans sp.]|nr:BLUF domain-containing protein [Oceanihabitans sp.]
MKLHRLVYTSQATILFNKRDLLDLLHESRGYNMVDSISGVLMHKKGFFLQVIEGEPEAIDNLISRLKKDSRHSNIKILYESPIEKRLFQNWAMGCADFDDPTLSMLPGLRTDLSDSKVINSLVNRLPEVANFLIENLTEPQINDRK